MSSDVFLFHQGMTPLLISMPHVGTEVPPELAERMTEAARTVPDTDWHVDRLYDFAADLGASLIVPRYSRYVADLNRPPDGRPLYPGADNTELCPTRLFDGDAIYRPGESPDEAEVAERLAVYWRPYHERLTRALMELKDRFGYALLFDAHSIRSRVPRFFEGRLPDLNLGTGGGASADPGLADRLLEVCRRAEGYTAVLNGRFTGGYITRHYGDPGSGTQAVQLELSQITYMDEDPPFAFDEARADRLRPNLRRLIEALLDFQG